MQHAAEKPVVDGRLVPNIRLRPFQRVKSKGTRLRIIQKIAALRHSIPFRLFHRIAKIAVRFPVVNGIGGFRLPANGLLLAVQIEVGKTLQVA